jgi:hypothetical protein
LFGDFIRLLATLFTLITLLGLYKPWIVFWWSDFSNRKKVLSYYGAAALVLWVFYVTWQLVN